MMDESVARYNLDEVSKAPVKRKSQGNEENLQQGASLKMHKKVRSSLRNISSDSKMENSESNIVVDGSGDAKEKNKGDIQQKKKKKSFRGGRCSSSPRMDADSLIETDKACDRQNNQMSADNSRNSEQLSNTEMNTSKYMTAGKLGKQKSNSNRSTRMEDACLGDMYFTDDMSECSTVTERSVTVKSKINRSLATCLESMKNTVQCIHSPQYSESPALLVSPSLSGISQLSDLSANSSGCDVQKIQEESICQHKNLSDELLEIPKEVIKISEPNSKGLCDMFQNLSPPEKLGSIQSNRRIARSSVSSGNSNFATLYKDEEIFI